MNDAPGEEGGLGAESAFQGDLDTVGGVAPTAPLPPPPLPPPPPTPPPASVPPGLVAPPRRPRRRWVPFAVLAAILLVGGGVLAGVLTSGSRSEVAVRRASPAPAPTVAPPTGLTASKSPFGVTLSWSPPATGRVQTYLIYRNETLIGQVPAPGLGYSDEPLTPGRRYHYEIRAANGSIQSGPVRLMVITPKPPLAKATIEGDFDVHVKVESATGFSNYDSSYTTAWRFSRKCASGVCVAWRDLSEASLRGVFTRNGTTYTGDDTGKLGTCHGIRATGSVTISFHVAKARGLEGEWRATKLVGTWEESTVSQLGCVATHAVKSFVATSA